MRYGELGNTIRVAGLGFELLFDKGSLRRSVMRNAPHVSLLIQMATKVLPRRHVNLSRARSPLFLRGVLNRVDSLTSPEMS